MNNCAKCGSPAVEQIRGQMGEGDYKNGDVDYHKKVHMDDAIKHDFRVSCTQCQNASGWQHVMTVSENPAMTAPVAAIMRQGLMTDLQNEWNQANPAST